jgi:hypothetical protein
MDDLAFLHARIESYADYTNDDDRRMSDEQIRAYVGEALAGVLERLAPTGEVGETLARLLLRCQFADQTVVAALDAEQFVHTELALLHTADRRLVELADRAGALALPDVRTLLADIDATFDERARIIVHNRDAPPTGMPLR